MGIFSTWVAFAHTVPHPMENHNLKPFAFKQQTLYKSKNDSDLFPSRLKIEEYIEVCEICR